MKFFNRISNYLTREKADIKWVTFFSIFIFVIIVGSLFLFAYDVYINSYQTVRWMEVFSTTMMIAVASMLVGMLMGFIFGIPRSQQHMAETAHVNENNKENRALMVNTNLEQISDWLTKIIVGVGLVEMNNISKEFYNLVIFLSSRIGLDDKEAIIYALIIAGLVSGFIFGYLITRIYLTRAFSRVTTEEYSEEEKIIETDSSIVPNN